MYSTINIVYLEWNILRILLHSNVKGWKYNVLKCSCIFEVECSEEDIASSWIAIAPAYTLGWIQMKTRLSLLIDQTDDNLALDSAYIYIAHLLYFAQKNVS